MERPNVLHLKGVATLRRRKLKTYLWINNAGWLGGCWYIDHESLKVTLHCPSWGQMRWVPVAEVKAATNALPWPWYKYGLECCT
jgi:hypothetical protein